MTRPTKAQLIQRLANLTRTAGAPIAPADDRPRWKDGSLKDPLHRLEESLDLERLLGNPVLGAGGAVIGTEGFDPEYQLANMDAWKRLIRLRTEREKETREAEVQQAARDRIAARHEYEQSLRDSEAESKAEKERAREEAIDLFYKTGGASPLPKE
jgi:hypothetical protein